MRDVLALDITQNGLYVSVPIVRAGRGSERAADERRSLQLTQCVFKMLISTAADRLRQRYGFSATVMCKTVQTFSRSGGGRRARLNAIGRRCSNDGHRHSSRNSRPHRLHTQSFGAARARALRRLLQLPDCRVTSAAAAATASLQTAALSAFTATLYLAPQFTGTLSSLTALAGALGGISCPALVGVLMTMV